MSIELASYKITCFTDAADVGLEFIDRRVEILGVPYSAQFALDSIEFHAKDVCGSPWVKTEMHETDGGFEIVFPGSGRRILMEAV